MPFGKAVGVIAQVISRQIGYSAAGRIVNLNPIVVFEEIIHCNRAVACEDFVDAQVEVLSGISAGDQVIRLDLGKLKVGTKAQIEGEESLSAQSKSEKTQSWWQRLLALFGKKTTPSEK